MFADNLWPSVREKYFQSLIWGCNIIAIGRLASLPQFDILLCFPLFTDLADFSVCISQASADSLVPSPSSPGIQHTQKQPLKITFKTQQYFIVDYNNSLCFSFLHKKTVYQLKNNLLLHVYWYWFLRTQENHLLKNIRTNTVKCTGFTLLLFWASKWVTWKRRCKASSYISRPSLRAVCFMQNSLQGMAL